MRILGISAFYHDSAAALLEDGRLVAAAQEERFSRKKHDSGYPARAVEYCLAAAGTTLDRVDYVAFYDKPFLKFERLLETYVAFAPRGFRSFAKAVPVWLKEKLSSNRCSPAGSGMPHRDSIGRTSCCSPSTISAMPRALSIRRRSRKRSCSRSTESANGRPPRSRWDAAPIS